MKRTLSQAKYPIIGFSHFALVSRCSIASCRKLACTFRRDTLRAVDVRIGSPKEIEMNRLLKNALLGLAVAATTLSVLPSAQAGDGWRRNNRYNHYNRYDSGDVVAAGVLGLAVGALAAGVAAAARPGYYYYDRVPAYGEPVYRERVYREGPVRAYQARTYARGLEPWSPEWYDYCESRYRSFNPRTGTFTGYDGVRRFCAGY
jgi:BA14K-like protein